MQWARDLPDPTIYESLRIAQPLTPIRGYGTAENHLRHFERMHRWPTGFIVTGDAVCAFNPIYGQGMTVSAMDAITLQRCLQEQQRSPRTDFEQHFQHQLAKITAPAWLGPRPALVQSEVERCSSQSWSALVTSISGHSSFKRSKTCERVFQCPDSCSPAKLAGQAAHGRTCPGSST